MDKYNAENLIFKPITDNEKYQIKDLDAERDYGQIYDFVQDCIEDSAYDDVEQDYVYGVFDADGKLLAYCTIGYADGIKGLKPTDYILSDVYVRDGYRHKGIGEFMVQNAVATRKNTTIWLIALNQELEYFYKRLGFTLSDSSTGLMYYTV